MREEDVKAFATKLRSEGIDAHEWGESIGGGGGILIGIVVKDLGFFPVWELNEPGHQTLLAERDFAAIKASRDPDWEPVEPRFWKWVRRQGD